MLSRPKMPLFLTLLLFNALPNLAEASLGANPPPIVAGDRVLATGSLHRKCSARVSSIPSPGYAQLQFDRPGCGDSVQAYEIKHLQHLSVVEKSHNLSIGDPVVLKGHFSADCAGRVRELSRSGYVSVDLDSLLCADNAALYRASEVTKIEFVTEKDQFSVGQKVSAKGIREDETCRGEISKLTSTGLAQVSFDQLTCAYAGKLYPLGLLSAVKAPVVRKRVSGELIFQRVMREIASSSKGKSKKTLSAK
ncbi:MAG: hypothetical protein ACXWR4_06780 [Bdellovibrionota bacterium]